MKKFQVQFFFFGGGKAGFADEHARQRPTESLQFDLGLVFFYTNVNIRAHPTPYPIKQ